MKRRPPTTLLKLQVFRSLFPVVPRLPVKRHPPTTLPELQLQLQRRVRMRMKMRMRMKKVVASLINFTPTRPAVLRVRRGEPGNDMATTAPTTPPMEHAGTTCPSSHSANL
jgi:hypothetical protein